MGLSPMWWKRSFASLITVTVNTAALPLVVIEGDWMGRRVQCTGGLALIALSILSLTRTATAGEIVPKPSEGVVARAMSMCAAYDLLHITQIEAHARGNIVEASTLASAFGHVLHARSLCSTGHHQEALSLYSRVPLGPPLVETVP